MIYKHVTRARSLNWGRTLSLLLIVTLVMPALALAYATTPTPAAAVQPALLALAAEQPQATVRVIVQKIVQDDSVENLVARLGGTVIKDLHIINAFAAQLPAKAVPELARAAGVRWVSLDAPVVTSGKKGGGGGNGGGGRVDCVALGCPPNYYLDTLNVRPVWDMGYDGTGVTVAVVDSGIAPDQDFTMIRASFSFATESVSNSDVYGHGTHVAGIIAGNGYQSYDFYKGVAPGVELISLKIADGNGMAYESDTVDALQWVLDHKTQFNIRVVNMSLNSTQEQSYHTSPLDAAVEILWFNEIVVVVSAGNKGPGGGLNTIDMAPANDPFVITVGASDEHGTPKIRDDTVAPFSAYGVTLDGFAKPEIIAPGKDIYSVLAQQSDWETQHPDRVVAGEYFRISGTSMAAPMVAGAAALLLQAEPNLNPDQVKYRLVHAGNTVDASTSGPQKDYPYLDVYAAITGNTTETANTGVEASQLLWTGDDPVTWGSVNWGSVNWGSVNWGSVNWGSVNWGSVNWGSVSWDD